MIKIFNFRIALVSLFALLVSVTQADNLQDSSYNKILIGKPGTLYGWFVSTAYVNASCPATNAVPNPVLNYWIFGSPSTQPTNNVVSLGSNVLYNLIWQLESYYPYLSTSGGSTGVFPSRVKSINLYAVSYDLANLNSTGAYKPGFSICGTTAPSTTCNGSSQYFTGSPISSNRTLKTYLSEVYDGSVFSQTSACLSVTCNDSTKSCNINNSNLTLDLIAGQ